MTPDVPNLASQNADYLLEQMNKFVQGQRKSSAFMAGMIKDSQSRKIIFNEEFDFIAPDYVITEIEKYR